MNRKNKNWLAVLAFFLASYSILDMKEFSLSASILGVAFIIAGTFGIVSLFKRKSFIF